MTLDRDTIGDALHRAGVEPEKIKKAQDSILAAQDQESKPHLRPWTFPAFTIRPVSKNV